MKAGAQIGIVARKLEKLRAAAWIAAQDLVEFGTGDLASSIGTSAERAEAIIQSWLVEGVVEITQMRIGSARQKVRIIAHRTPTTRPARTPEENMWHALRRLRSASPTDLAAHATTEVIQVTPEQAASYCRSLLAAGYLRVSRKAAPRSAREAIYNLARDTGPKPPRVARVRAVIDPNTGVTHLLGGVA